MSAYAVLFLLIVYAVVTNCIAHERITTLQDRVKRLENRVPVTGTINVTKAADGR